MSGQSVLAGAGPLPRAPRARGLPPGATITR
jgi:hypothetical protein